MKISRFIYYFVAIILLLSSFNLPLKVNFTPSPLLWTFLRLSGGILSILFLFSNLNIWVKILYFYLYINCFLSIAPDFSYMGFIWVSFCVIFYWLLTKLEIKDYIRLYKIFVMLFLMQILFLGIQFLNKDFVLNAGRAKSMLFGTIGNPMMLGSYFCCLIAPLMLNKKWLILPVLFIIGYLRISGAFISIIAGILFYFLFYFLFRYISKKKAILSIISIIITTYLCIFIFTKLDDSNIWGGDWSGRLPVWKRAIEMGRATPTPLTGWGLSTFKMLFPMNSKNVSGELDRTWQIGNFRGNWVVWNVAHNDYIETWYELGWVGFTLFLMYLSSLWYKFLKIIKIVKIVKIKYSDDILIIGAGLITIGVNMFGAFPLRMWVTVPIIIFLLSLFEKLYASHNLQNDLQNDLQKKDINGYVL